MRCSRSASISEAAELHRNNVQIRHVGTLEGIQPRLAERVRAAVELTRDNTRPGPERRVQLRRPPARSRAPCGASLGEGVAAEDVTEDLIDQLPRHGRPADLDLVIRTGGEMRLSNFLLWQAAYAEYYSTPICWPDFGREELYQAFAEFGRRARRFGGLTLARVRRRTTQPSIAAGPGARAALRERRRGRAVPAGRRLLRRHPASSARYGWSSAWRSALRRVRSARHAPLGRLSRRWTWRLFGVACCCRSMPGCAPTADVWRCARRHADRRRSSLCWQPGGAAGAPHHRSARWSTGRVAGPGAVPGRADAVLLAAARACRPSCPGFWVMALLVAELGVRQQRLLRRRRLSADGAGAQRSAPRSRSRAPWPA